ncbi:MAG: DUF4271 domain-containing protein [Bacteroidales bacterium]
MRRTPLVLLLVVFLVLLPIATRANSNKLAGILQEFRDVDIRPDTLQPVVRPANQVDPADTVPPAAQQPPDTMPEAPPASVVPASSRATVPAPGPVSVQATPPAEPARPPFDASKAYTVAWDSLLYHPQPSPSRIFPASQFFGNHLLSLTSEIKPQPLAQPKNNDAFTSLIIICLILLAIARYFFPVRFKETLMALWEIRYYNQLQREGDFFRNWVSVFLSINYLISLGLLFHQTIAAFSPGAMSLVRPDILYLALITGAILGFYLFKILMMYFLAWVFQTQNPTHAYLYNIVIANLIAGLAILPFLIANIYTPSAIFVQVAWILLLLINVYKMARGVLIGLNAAGFSAYYLILYLCAIELAPLLFIIKYVQNITLS